MKYQVEKWEDFYKDAIPLFEAHWKELENDRDGIVLNIDHERYKALDDNGFLLITTARDEELIGYIVNVVSENLHCKELMSENDSLYVKPEYRSQGIFSELLDFTIKTLKEMNVSKMHIHTKVWQNFGGLLEKNNFVEIERNYELNLRN